MSDVQATTQPGAADFSMPDESAFQSLYDGGAFEPSTNANAAADAEAQRRAQEGAQNAQTGQQEDGAQSQGQENGDGAQGQQDGQQAAAKTEEAPTYSSLDELLTSLKVDPASAKSLAVTVKVDGVETQVPLEKVLHSYQLEGHVNNKSIEVSNQKQALEQERVQWRQATQQALQQHQAMGQLAMQLINHDFQKVDWNTLRANNPAEFAALQSEFQQRQGQIQQFLGQVQQHQAQAQHEQQQAMQQNLAAERDKLQQAIPEWRDPAAFEKDRQQIAQYARNLGFQDAELSQIFDHRYMRVLHDAARYRALQAAAPQALKQVRQAPPAAAPGSRTNANPSDSRRQAAIERFNRNPGDEDAQAAVFSLFE
jgi:hypothetical protein